MAGSCEVLFREMGGIPTVSGPAPVCPGQARRSAECLDGPPPIMDLPSPIMESRVLADLDRVLARFESLLRTPFVRELDNGITVR